MTKIGEINTENKFESAFNKAKEILNWERNIEHLSDDIRHIVEHIIEQSEKRNLDLQEITAKYFLEESKNYTDLLNIINKLNLELKSQLEKIENLAFYDELTWLPNLKKLKLDIEENNINELHLVKINSFSELNTIYWHDIWDIILNKIIETGDAFLSWTNHKIYRTWRLELRIIWENNKEISKIIKENMSFEIKLDEIWTSILVRLSASFVNSETSLYDRGLEALYESKKTWKYIEYSEKLDTNIKLKIENNIFWLKEVKNAIENANIKAYFQWIRNNKSGEIYKYEALARIEKDWKVYNPWQFLDAAQRWLLIKDITKAIIKQTIWEIKRTWFSISVNITESDLSDKKMMEFIENEIINSWIKAEKLSLEVLENITEVDSFHSDIANLKKLWVKIAIDDFWTWFSNFARMIKIKPDYLKIDWSLIKWIWIDKEKIHIVRSIVDLAHINWYKVIAEFVDNEIDQQVVEELRIDYSQWYLFSEPKREI